MVNHVRTLLMNLDGSSPAPPWAVGEEPLDPGYRAVAVPAELAIVRQRLFGADPDRNMLNYRCHQLLGVVHATELGGWALAKDPRVTYLGRPRPELFAADAFTPAVEGRSGSPPLAVVGAAGEIDAHGRMWHQYLLRTAGSELVELLQQAPRPRLETLALSVTAGLSEPLPLGDSGYGVRLTHPAADQLWRIGFNIRPQWDLGQILAGLDVIGEPVLLGLFGVSPDEPLKTFKNLFHDHAELPWRLGAAVLALAWQLDNVRTGRWHG